MPRSQVRSHFAKDYYRLFAFFNNVPEHGEDGRIANAAPLIAAPTREQQQQLAEQRTRLKEYDDQIAALRRTLIDSADFKTKLSAFANSYATHRSAAQGKNDATVPASATASSNGPPANADSTKAAQAENKAPQSKESEEPKIKVLTPAFAINCDDVNPVEKKWKFLDQAPTIGDGVVGGAWKITGEKAVAEIAGGQLNIGKRMTIAMWIKPNADTPRDVALLSGVNYDGNPNSSGYGKGHEIRLIDGEIEVRSNDFFPAYALRVQSRSARITANEWHHVTVVLGGSRHAKDVHIFVDGRELFTEAVTMAQPATRLVANSPYVIGGERSKKSAVYRGELDELSAFTGQLTPAEIKQWFTDQALPYVIKRLQAAQAADHERQWVIDAWIEQTQRELAAIESQRDQLWQAHLTLYRSCPSAMVMQELPTPRKTSLLKRGAYDALGDEVTAEVPHWIADWPEHAPRNRLGLAQWLTSRSHPLCARVVVNRLWAQLFGSGIVRTLEDFGFQGDYPSHPELLDWLACEFMDSGWDVKALVKTIVLSKTYRQSSQVTSEQLARDPENRWLARAPRIRLSAETLRDQALMLSGLLRERVGGPSVFPYQPDGLYNGLVVGATYPGTQWELSKGDDLFRRTLYLFIKRTVPHPLMQTFDAPDREFCTVRQIANQYSAASVAADERAGLLRVGSAFGPTY